MRPVLLLLLLVTTLVAAAPERFSGYALVNDDGSLRVAGRTVHLFGIYIPPTDETCFTFQRPVRCGPRAVLTLEFRIGSGFIHCRTMAERPDGSVEAVCTANSGPLAEPEDLAEYMLSHGWAIARPEAPFEYHAQERIARKRGLGVWGIPLGGPELGR